MFLRSGGYGVMTGPCGEKTETDSFTCKHCNTVVFVAARQRPENLGGMCMVCMGLICPRCVGKSCTPFEKRLEQMERG
jgi:hypothetical protein